MALSNYTELQAHIADTLNRDDLSTVIPEFIVMAESRLNRDIRHWRMEKRATASFDAQYTALPTDFLQPIRFVVETTPICTLEQQNAKGIADLREISNATGKPTSYCILDGSIEVSSENGLTNFCINFPLKMSMKDNYEKNFSS